MIEISISYKGNKIKEVVCSGHSGYAEKGKDIVCSAVSAIVQTALLGLIEISEEKVLYNRKDGYLKFVCPSAKSEKEDIRQDAILKTMYLGLRDMQNGYKALIRMEEYTDVY